MQKSKGILQDLHLFLAIVLALLVTGFIFVYSASSIFALERYGNSNYFIKRQCIGLIIGFIGLIIGTCLPLSLIKKSAYYLFATTLALVSLTLFPSISTCIHGSSRWINLFGIMFQPSEMLKITFLLTLARYVEHSASRSTLKRYLPLLFIIALPSIILLKQPDFGMTVTFIATTFIVLFIANVSIYHLAISVSLCIPLIAYLVIMKSYRLKRVLIFLNPWQEPTGSGFQIIQSLIAIGNGGLYGLGIGHSKQKFFYLPMQHTDFIFSIIAEEIGFAGSVFVIMLYALLIYFGIRIAWKTPCLFSTFSIIGFVVLIGLQATINIAVTTGLVPTKGLALPFVSYGNTALVCNLSMIGLIINMVLHTIAQEHVANNRKIGYNR